MFNIFQIKTHVIFSIFFFKSKHMLYVQYFSNQNTCYMFNIFQIKTHVICSIFFKSKHMLYVQYFSNQNRCYMFNFFSKIVPFFKIMWKNIIQVNRPQMTIWRMGISGWIPKATNTHTEYGIHVAFPRQKWLH